MVVYHPDDFDDPDMEIPPTVVRHKPKVRLNPDAPLPDPDLPVEVSAEPQTTALATVAPADTPRQDRHAALPWGKDDGTPEPWEKWPTDSHRSYYLFTLYRDLGHDRSLKKVAEEVGCETKTLSEHSSQGMWVARARAWDEYVDWRKREKHIREVEEMGVRHAKLAQMFQQKVIERISNLDPSDIPPGALINMFETAVKLERQAMGVTNDNVGPAGGGGQTNLQVQVYLPQNNRDEPTIEVLRLPEKGTVEGEVTEVEEAEYQDVTDDAASDPTGTE